MSISLPLGRRILIVTGHYGSGKTEFAVSLALLMAKPENRKYKKIALIDLDIAQVLIRADIDDHIARVNIEYVVVHAYNIHIPLNNLVDRYFPGIILIGA